ncbi:MAG: helix-turn-helix domain-containing protein [Candidatus Woesearchaeota archaeon]
MNNFEPLLKEIGLTESEKKVYLALLSLGVSTRNNIVKESGISGSKVYEVLEKLQEKGLISTFIANKVKNFKPTNPNQLLNYLEQKKDEINALEKQAKLAIPGLLSLFNSSKEDQEVEILSGMKGLEIIFREQIDLLKPGEVCYVMGGTKGMNEEAVWSFFRKIHILREQKKIKTRMLFNQRQKENTERLYSSKQFPSTSTRYIEHTSPVAIDVYKDRTVIIISGKKITSIYIKSQEVAQSFLEYFQMMWKTAKK